MLRGLLLRAPKAPPPALPPASFSMTTTRAIMSSSCRGSQQLRLRASQGWWVGGPGGAPFTHQLRLVGSSSTREPMDLDELLADEDDSDGTSQGEGRGAVETQAGGGMADVKPYLFEDYNEPPADEVLEKLPPFEPVLMQHVVGITRSVKVTKGGRIQRFRALVVVGDGKGRVGFGTGMGMDSRQATEKAQHTSRESFMEVPLWQGRSLYHDVYAKYNATRVMIRRAPFGQGVKAARVQYLILNALGIKDATCKVRGSTNMGNVVRATFLALAKARSLEGDCKMRGVDQRQFVHGDEALLYDDRLYVGGDFTFKELTGRDSKFDLRSVELENGDRAVRALDGGIPREEGRTPNPKFVEWDRIAEHNEEVYYQALDAAMERDQREGRKGQRSARDSQPHDAE